MLPYITVFGASFSSYSITAGIGFFAMWLAAWLATRRQNDIDQNHIPHIAVTAMAGLFLGAHLRWFFPAPVLAFRDVFLG